MKIEPPPEYIERYDHSTIDLRIINQKDWCLKAFTYNGLVYYVEPFLDTIIWSWSEGRLRAVHRVHYNEYIMTAAKIWHDSNNDMPVHEFLAATIGPYFNE